MDKCQTTVKCTVNKAKIHNSVQIQLPFILGKKVRDIYMLVYVYTVSGRRHTNRVAVIA